MITLACQMPCQYPQIMSCVHGLLGEILARRAQQDNSAYDDS